MPEPMLVELVEKIKRSPRVYFRRPSVTELARFLGGFCLGLDCAEPSQFPHCRSLPEFRKWLAVRAPNEAEFPEIELQLLSLCDGDEEIAFARFFDYWEEFLRTNENEE